eukprot:412962-Pyramimonas_sp.AAC.1
MICGPHGKGLPPWTSSQVTCRRGSCLIPPPNSGLRSPKVTTDTKVEWPPQSSDVTCGPQRERAPARDFLAMALTDEAPA